MSLSGFPSLLAGCLTVLAAAGCASGFGGSTATPDEGERLKRQAVELRQRATVAEMEAARLKRENARLETELEEAEQARRAPSGSEMEPEPTTPETIGLDPGIEETDLQEEPVAEPAPEEVAPEPPDSEPAAVEPQATAVEPEAAGAGPIVAPPAEAQMLYDQGYSLFHQQRYADAEAQFRRYVEQYPRTDLTDNALFWIGECLYARGELSSALEVFSETVERFPQGNKVSDALLKAGRCLVALGDKERARRTFEEVARRYPGSSAAAQARDALRDLS